MIYSDPNSIKHTIEDKQISFSVNSKFHQELKMLSLEFGLTMKNYVIKALINQMASDLIAMKEQQECKSGGKR